MDDAEQVRMKEYPLECQEDILSFIGSSGLCVLYAKKRGITEPSFHLVFL